MKFTAKCLLAKKRSNYVHSLLKHIRKQTTHTVFLSHSLMLFEQQIIVSNYHMFHTKIKSVLNNRIKSYTPSQYKMMYLNSIQARLCSTDFPQRVGALLQPGLSISYDVIAVELTAEIWGDANKLHVEVMWSSCTGWAFMNSHAVLPLMKLVL